LTSKKHKNLILLLIISIALVLSTSSSAVVIGDWEGAPDGWIDWDDGQISINDSSLMPGKYEYATYGATLGSQSIKLWDLGLSNTLSIKLNSTQRAAFLANDIFSIDLSVAADTLGVGGYARIEKIIINATGIGWTATALGQGLSFWAGSPAQSMTLEFDYSALKAGIPADPGYINIILQTTGRRATDPYSEVGYYFDNAQLLPADPPEPPACTAQWDLAGDDCQVDFADFSVFAQSWMLATNGYDITDFQDFSQEWLQCHSMSCKPNILFIAVDDLRPELNCFGKSNIISPNIDSLAAEGVLFSRSYCQVPVCGASRASLLTGIRPNRTRFVTYNTRADEDAPSAITLPEHFKNNGYYTVGNGKIFHNNADSADSWSESHWAPSGHYLDYQLQENIDLVSTYGYGAAYENADVAYNAYKGGKIADKAISDIQRLKDLNQPFFLAVGFYKPHLPFNAPTQYWNMYPEASIELPDNYYAPSNVPAAALHEWGELRSYYGIPETGPLSDELARTLIRGYYASTTYTDAMIGMILDELEALGLKDNTIVVLWGDHGWNLGEHTLWAKHCNFDTSLRSPLIISAPGYSQNIQCDSIVEFVDIYPTLCELTGLDQPAPAQLHGQSLVPILTDPQVSVKDTAFCRWNNGDSVRTDQYLFTEWTYSSGSLYARMLYDHYVDPNENENIAEDSSLQNVIDTVLSPLLDEIRLY
jgi:arylsulfatase A-like enzyme